MPKSNVIALNDDISLKERGYNLKHIKMLSSFHESMLEPQKFEWLYYQRITLNGKMLYLSPSKKWLNRTHNHRHILHKQTIENSAFLKNRKTDIIPLPHHGDAAQLLHKFDFKFGVTLFEKHEDILHAWTFVTKEENGQYFHYKDIDIIKLFCCVFKDKLLSFAFGPDSYTRYNLSKKTNNCANDTNQTPINNYEKLLNGSHIEINGKVIKISKREISCLKEMFKCKSMKEIAQTMSISHRSVETYVNNLKNKLGIYRQSELYSKLSGLTENWVL